MMDLVFTVNSTNGTMQCIDIVIIDSPTMDKDETFIVTLTSSILALGNNVTTVIITDTDSM